MEKKNRVFAFSTPEPLTAKFERELQEDLERSRKLLHSPHPRCESCDVRLNRYTVHKPDCTA